MKVGFSWHLCSNTFISLGNDSLLPSVIMFCNKYSSNLLSFSLEHKRPFMQKKFIILCPERVVAKIHTQKKSFNRKSKIGRNQLFHVQGVSQPEE